MLGSRRFRQFGIYRLNNSHIFYGLFSTLDHFGRRKSSACTVAEESRVWPDHLLMVTQELESASLSEVTRMESKNMGSLITTIGSVMIWKRLADFTATKYPG